MSRDRNTGVWPSAVISDSHGAIMHTLSSIVIHGKTLKGQRRLENRI